MCCIMYNSETNVVKLVKMKCFNRKIKQRTNVNNDTNINLMVHKFEFN